MKKLLGVSIAAMLAVTPMMANATTANHRALTPATVGNVSENKNIATTSYVKGAYNAVATEVNAIAGDIAITTGENETLNNINTTDSIATNVKTLDEKMGNVGNLGAATGVLATSANTTDLVTAVKAINTALAGATSDATVQSKEQGNYNQITAGASTAANLIALDTAVGQVDGTKTYLTTIGDGTGEASVGDNLNSLNDAIGNVTTTGTYIAPIGTGANDKTVAQNLKALDTQVKSNYDAIEILNGDGTAGSVKKTVIDNAAAATFAPASGSGLTSNTLQAAINEVQNNLNNANTDAALLQGHYYEYDGNDKDTVASAIQKVDGQVYTNTTAIAAINAKQIQLYGNWETPDASTTTVTISQLP